MDAEQFGFVQKPQNWSRQGDSTRLPHLIRFTAYRKRHPTLTRVRIGCDWTIQRRRV